VLPAGSEKFQNSSKILPKTYRYGQTNFMGLFWGPKWLYLSKKFTQTEPFFFFYAHSVTEESIQKEFGRNCNMTFGPINGINIFLSELQIILFSSSIIYWNFKSLEYGEDRYNEKLFASQLEIKFTTKCEVNVRFRSIIFHLPDIIWSEIIELYSYTRVI